MQVKYLAAAGALLLASAGAAAARRDPVPPPSGIVVHLFGPDSITSHMLPNDLGFGPARDANAPVASNGAGTPVASNGAGTPVPSGGAPAAGGTGVGPQAGTVASSYPEPTMHQILHEMFVTGDPNLVPGSNLAKGRQNDRP